MTTKPTFDRQQALAAIRHRHFGGRKATRVFTCRKRQAARRACRGDTRSR